MSGTTTPPRVLSATACGRKPSPSSRTRRARAVALQEQPVHAGARAGAAAFLRRDHLRARAAERLLEAVVAHAQRDADRAVLEAVLQIDAAHLLSKREGEVMLPRTPRGSLRTLLTGMS